MKAEGKAAPPQTEAEYIPKAGECRDSKHVELERVNKELLGALRKYGKHLTACACFEEFDEKACDCGFGKYEAAL